MLRARVGPVRPLAAPDKGLLAARGTDVLYRAESIDQQAAEDGLDLVHALGDGQDIVLAGGLEQEVADFAVGVVGPAVKGGAQFAQRAPGPRWIGAEQKFPRAGPVGPPGWWRHSLCRGTWWTDGCVLHTLR